MVTVMVTGERGVLVPAADLGLDDASTHFAEEMMILIFTNSKEER